MVAQTWQALASFNPYRTVDLDAAREHISTLFVPHQLDVVGPGQMLDVCVSHATIEGASIVYHRHGASSRVRPVPLRDFFLLQIPLTGTALVRFSHQELHCSPAMGLMISPDMEVDMRFGRGCDHLIVRVEKSDLERHLEAQLGRELGAPLKFAPAVPLTTSGAQEIKALLQLMTVSLLNSQGMCASTIARKQMVSLLLASFLRCLDHNYRDELSQGAKAPLPAHIRRAQDFMAAHVCDPIGPEDIAGASHVSVRALYAGFSLALNTTPMRYLKNLRLDRVRDYLLQPTSTCASVTHIALQFGFEHLGHFSIAYKRRFGELPSETLNHSRSKAPGDL